MTEDGTPLTILTMIKRGKPGPKPKRAADRLIRVIGLRVTNQEYRHLALLARKERISLGAWARARLLKAVEEDASLESLGDKFENRSRKQDQALAKTQKLLTETIRLYQSANPRTAIDEDEAGD